MSTVESSLTRPPGRRIAGPGAFGGDPKRFVNLTRTLAITDFKLRFYGSVLGYLWTLMRPLMLFGVLYIVFTEFVRIGGDVQYYPMVLLSGIVMYTFLAESTSLSVTSVIERENLVRKIEFPRLVIPLATVSTAFLYLLLNFVAVLIFGIISGVQLHASIVQFPLIIGALGALALGLSMLLSSLYVRYRDVKPIWDVILQLLFYGTPVLYPIEAVSNRTAQELLMINPFAVIVQQFRHAVIDPTAPSAATVVGGIPRLLLPMGILVGIFVLGLWVFQRSAPRIAEEL